MQELSSFFLKKKILVYGLGISGFSSLRYLKNKNDVKFYDDNFRKLKNNKIKKFFISKNKIFKYGFDIIILSPGINKEKSHLKKFLSKNNHKIYTDLDIFYCNNAKNITIAVTGTNGKSTTVQLLHDIIKSTNKDVRLAGNIGNSVLNEKKITERTIFVIETSSYQIEYSKIFKAKYAILLNISPDHLERHKTFNNYLNTKLKLFLIQNKNDFAFFNKKNYFIKKQLKNKKINSQIINVKNYLKPYLENSINNQYFGNKNNLQNLSFIFSLCKILKIKQKQILKVINNFKGLKFRQQLIYNSKKLKIINDSKATSFASSENLISSLRNVFWILGGLPKKGDNFKLKNIQKYVLKAFIFGKDKNFFIKNLKNKIPFKTFSNLKEALRSIFFEIKKKKYKHKITILFSPSAASFDSFKNFEERGEYFNHLVKVNKKKYD